MSQQNLPPPPPSSLPEQPEFPRNRRTRYNRPRTYFSRWGLAFGIVFGILIGLGLSLIHISEPTRPY